MVVAHVHDSGSTCPLSNSQTHLLSSCTFCGYLPSILLSSNPMLAEFLQCDTWADLFQTLGIQNDTHFRVLLGMESADRVAFFGSFVSRRLTAADSMFLTRSLDEFASGHPWAGLTLKRIARKGMGFESFLSKSTTSIKLVAHSMRFSIEQYEFLATGITRRIPWYLDIHLAFEEQSLRQVQDLSREICEKYPRFEQYEDAWPIPVIIKRILGHSSMAYDVPASTCAASSAFDLGRSQDLAGCVQQIDESEPFLPPAHRRQHRCPHLANYHAGPRSISPTAKTLLSFLNMEEELAPALYFLGVRDDAQFQTVRRMSEARKSQLLMDTEDLKLTPFQRRVMYVIFEK